MPQDDSSWLNGRVEKFTLPIYESPPGQGGPVLKRLLLPQGELAQIHDDTQPIHYLAFVELRADTVRGNHFHHRKEEFIYVFGGRFILALEDPQTLAYANVPMQTGDLVRIAAGVAHTLRVSQSGQAIEYSPIRFDPADVHRYIIRERD